MNADNNSCVVQQADSQVIQETVHDLALHWKKGAWLGGDNCYLEDPVKMLKEGICGKKRQSHLTEYIAASSITHCFDGWSYLGRAFEAAMAGDTMMVRHLGYYAQLRAAMSILASQGIGVFSQKHVVVTKCKCKKIEWQCARGTHDFAWHALQRWANNSPASADVFLESIKPANKPLKEWVSVLPEGQYTAGKWLTQWGVDLKQAAIDKNARNRASYRPTLMANASSEETKTEEIVGNILKFWKILEPGSASGEFMLDRYLLRELLRNGYKDAEGEDAEGKYEKTLNRALNSLDLSDAQIKSWKSFLSYQNLEESHEVISDAKKEGEDANPDYSRQLLSRAVLLLRLASGITINLLADTGISQTNLFDGPSVQRRLWPESGRPDSFTDLWSDIDEASSSINEWLENGAEICLHDLWANRAREAAMLATTERVFLWSVVG